MTLDDFQEAMETTKGVGGATTPILGTTTKGAGAVVTRVVTVVVAATAAGAGVIRTLATMANRAIAGDRLGIKIMGVTTALSPTT